MVELGDAAIEIIDGDRGVNYPKKEDFKPQGFCLFLNTKNVRQEGFLFNELDFISHENDEKLRKGKLKRGDIVLTTRGTLGNVAIYDSKVPYENIRINSGMIILRPDTQIFHSQFLFKLIQSDFIRKQLSDLTSGSAQPQLPIRSLISLQIPLPSLSRQQQIVTRIEQEQQLINSNKELVKIFEEKIKDEINKLWQPTAKEYKVEDEKLTIAAEG
jgi:restriction endonuclease S subunit